MKAVQGVALASALIHVLTGAPARAGLDPAVKCEALKLSAAGKKAGAALKCHSKDRIKGGQLTICMGKAGDKFGAAFAKAESQVACSEPGDAASVEAQVDAFVADIASDLPSGVDGAKCASKKLAAAGKKAQALFKALSKDTKKADAEKFSDTFGKAQAKLQKAFDKAEAKLACETGDDSVAVRLDIDTFVEDVVDAYGACPQQLLYGNEGNRLRRYDLDTVDVGPLVEDILIERASVDPVNGRDVNGEICVVPDGSGDLVMGEDTGQPSPPAGWGVFDSTGTQVGKQTPTYFSSQPEPFGCEFDSSGRLFTSSIGDQPAGFNGQLIMWFPPFDEFPGAPGAYPATDDSSTNFCKIATDINVSGTVAVDELDRVYVASSAGFHVRRYSPPFPTAPTPAGGCGLTDGQGSPVADTVNEETFVSDPANVPTPSGIVRAPNGNWYISSVLTGVIAEYDDAGNFVRRVLEPPAGGPGTLPLSVGHPQGLAVDCRTSLYYADLALVNNGGSIGPGPGGTVRKIRFDLGGTPYDPVVVKGDLAFPDGLGILDGDLETP